MIVRQSSQRRAFRWSLIALLSGAMVTATALDARVLFTASLGLLAVLLFVIFCADHR